MPDFGWTDSGFDLIARIPTAINAPFAVAKYTGLGFLQVGLCLDPDPSSADWLFFTWQPNDGNFPYGLDVEPDHP